MLLLERVWPIIAQSIVSAITGRTSTCKSTVAALIVRGLKCVINIIDNSIEFALYRVRVQL